jgi:predicted Zn-dependent peptidase
MVLAGLLLTLLAPQVASPGIAGFHPDERLMPPGGPEIAIFRSVPPEVLSLRLSVPLVESPGEAGAGQLIQIQAEARMRALALRIGARAEVHRTPQALVYEVSGASADLDFLGWILREGLTPPAPQSFEDSRRSLRAELDRRLETPQGVLYVRIRELLSPETPSVTGTAGSLERLDPQRVHAVWARTHHRGAYRLVVAGRVPTELILAAFAGLGPREPPPPAELPAAQDTGSPRESPEVNRHWIVEARSLPDGAEAAHLVAAHWVAESIRQEGGDFEVGVEIWDVGRGRALVVSGAAFPRSRQAMDRRVSSALPDAAARLTEDRVRQLAGQIRTEILMAGRTPWGLAELVGQAWDSGHGPEGLESLLLELERVTLAEVLQLLQSVAAAPAIRQELHP